MYDLGRAFRAPFQDKDWVTKVLLGLLWGVLGVTIPAIYGAQLDYIRGVSEGDERLPEWGDFGKKWVEGLQVVLASIIFFLPMIVIGAIVFMPFLIAAVADNGDAAGGFAFGGMCLFSAIAAVYGIAVSLYFSAATVNFAMKGGFGSFFAFGEILEKIRGNSKYTTAWLYTLIVAAVGGAISGVLGSTGIGLVVSGAVTFLVAIISGHVLGQWAAVAYSRGGLSAAPASATAAPPIPTGLPVRPAPPAPGSVPPPPAPPAAAPVEPPVVPTPPAPTVAEPPAPPAPAGEPEVAAIPEVPAAPEAAPAAEAEPAESPESPDPGEPA